MVLSALSPSSDSKWAPWEKLALIAMVVTLSKILASAQRQLAVNGVQWGAAARPCVSRRRDDRLEAELQPALNLFGDFLKILCRVVWGNPFDNCRLFDKSARDGDIGGSKQGGRLELPLHRF
jgi:hypothetical protein